ncbi:unnamed protein product [Hydatigera taeniaeformis]|uniref:Protein-tyrosine-phosphatase n=1 Tax=Hydatigena taeniaeformis TaxID=6205 RepID=A0A0R3X6D8_HYDTA|nr:unnamed protein product [Hydatigera taeniaeformis]
MPIHTYLLLLTFLYHLRPLHRPTEAVVIEDRRKPWSDHDLRRIGNALLEHDKLVASFLDKVELTVRIPPGSNNKSLSYLIGKNQQFGFTITPCTGPLDGIHFHSTNSAKDGWQSDQSVFSAWTSRSRRSAGIFPSYGGRFWYRPPLRVEPLFLDGDLELHKVLKGPNWLKGSGTARLHFSSWGASGDTLVVTIYARPETTFRVLWSAKRDIRYQPFQGYPSLPQSSKASLIDTCRVTINSTDYLNVRWPPAINEDTLMVYCVALNNKRSLIHHCSLQLMLNSKKEAQEANLTHECTKANHLQLRLPSRLSRWQAEGHSLYINVYAINSSTNLSSSFPPLVMHSPPLCLHRRPVTRVWVKLRPVTYVLHWLNDIAFDWPRSFPDVSMYLQPCRRPRYREFLYNLEVFQQPLLDLSSVTQHFTSDGGQIRIRLSSFGENDECFHSRGDKIARLFFLTRSSNDSLPVRPRLAAHGSGTASSDKDLLESDDDSYPVEFTPDCKMHQITMRMVVSPLPHSYWITTLSIPEVRMLHHRNATLAGIANRINYCEYSNRSLASFLGRQTQIHFQRITTGLGDISLNVQLPIVYGEGSSRFYLILVYAARTNDVTSAYRSLFFHRLIDACRVVEDNCYATTHLGSICA